MAKNTEAASDEVDHPPHYGGERNPYEAIKVIEAWALGFNLGNTIKYIARADHKRSRLVDLRKAAWYLQREIEREARREAEKVSLEQHRPGSVLPVPEHFRS